MATYEDYLKKITSGMIGADGRFLGPGAGVNYQAEGMLPQQFYDFMNEQVADPMARDGFDGGYRARGVADPSWIPGAQKTGASGEFWGALAAALGGQALMGNFGAGGGFGATATPVTGGTVTGTELGALGSAAGGGSAGFAGLGEFPTAIGTETGFGGGFGSSGAGAGIEGFGGISNAIPNAPSGDWLKDNKTLVQLGGGLLGALAGKDTTTSASKDPWGPAQPYLKDNLAQNAAMQEHYRLNPFSNEQKAAYQGLLDTNANNQANAPIMQANANNFMQSKRGSMPAMQGLLSGNKAAPIDWAKYVIGKA